MALVVASGSQSSRPPDPTAALQTALSNFEDVLTAEQKKQFDDQVQRFNQQKPDAASVIQFIAQIDAENHNKTHVSVSSRLCTFLDATRQFTDIVDTFVSSNPTIAALVWGGIKTTILIANNATSYFEKVTNTIMGIGRICPIYREFSHLYSDSIGLQQSLCEYYAIVVRLVTRIVEVSQRTVVTSILSSVISPFESEFGPFQKQLLEASQLVDRQISLAAKQAAQASAKLLELESGENRQHRKFMRRFASEIKAEHDATYQMRIQDSARRAAKMRLLVRDQLSTINQQIPWNQAQKQRLPDTAEWFRQEQAFQAWKADRRSATLWCPGRMGVGKTVLVSNIIAYLHMSYQPGDIISYHFCRFDNEASVSARNILGTLTRQILDGYIEDSKGAQLQSMRDACQALDTDGVIDFLLPQLQINKRYYVVIDGLDECTQDQITILAESLAKLCNHPHQGIKVLCTGRPELKHQLFPLTKPKYRLPISKTVVNADIEHYINVELDECLQKQKIKLVNPETIWKIRDALYSGHDGLLLFVRLFIEEICILGNESAILKALGNPPKRINDLLAKRFDRVQAHDLAVDAVKILQYCGCLKRPLTVNEFSELLSISVNQTSLNRESIPQNLDQIIGACYGLIYVEEEEATIHYVHHSVKAYLFSNSNTPHKCFDEVETDIHLGCLCLTYLNFNDFKRQLTKVTATSGTPVAPIEIGLASVRSSYSVVNEIARKLLKVRRLPQQLTTIELSRKMENVLGQAESRRWKAELQSRPFYLLDYARNYWIWHTSRINETMQMWHHFSAHVRGEKDLAQRPWVKESHQQQTRKTSSMLSTEWALLHNHRALLLYKVRHQSGKLSDSETVDILRYAITANDHDIGYGIVHSKHFRSDMGQKGLYFAAYYGREHFLQLFIDDRANLNEFSREEPARTVLQLAAEGGHLGVVELLLAAGADVNAAAAACDLRGRTALQAAAEGGHLEVVERLLIAKADINAAACEYNGRTALQAAAGGGHLEVAERLLAARADVNTAAADLEGRTALQAAAERGYLEVIERLLAAGASVNASATRVGGLTALQAAAGGGHLEVVERLLAARADINADACEYNGRTALQAAAEGGHLEVVERLLVAGAEVNAAAAAEYEGRTALQAAAEGGHLMVIERLLAVKANVNAAASQFGKTALQAATDSGHLEVVERLLAAEADVNTAAGMFSGRTALQAAAEGGHLGVVERLLAAKAEINAAASSYGNTALQAAAGGGHLEVVERLLAARADINANAYIFKGRTALQAAAGGGHLEVVERLLAAKADVNAAAADVYGRTALQAAAERGYLKVVERLLAAKANVNAAAASQYGRTALQAATEGGHLEVVSRLKLEGARN